jgi:putative transcriptional regulator
MNKKYKSDIMASIHEIAVALYDSEIIDKKTMEEFDKSCLTSEYLNNENTNE